MEPLTFSFEVACPQERAFDLWANRIKTWWPSDHTVSGRKDVTVILESGVGGRIFERTPEGEEHDWGEVTAWEPPQQLSYLWHLGSDRSDATTVTVMFVPNGPEETIVRIEHDGWERLGSRAEERRNRNSAGWQSLVNYYVTATLTTSEEGQL
ncbi:MAG: SRPBCC domain-containing protein [Actinomycetes bacterium]